MVHGLFASLVELGIQGFSLSLVVLEFFFEDFDF
jgi:hypothetical protein